MPKYNNITGVVLGGGQSRRMGQDKRNLQLDGVKLLDRACITLSELFTEVLVVTAAEDYSCDHLPVQLVTDVIPHKGSLGGLYTGIKKASCPFVFVVGCDMPFLQPSVISRICEFQECDVVMVKLSTGLQPLHARYSKQCASTIEQMLHEGNLQIQTLVKKTDLVIKLFDESMFYDIDPHSLSFLNINTPSDFKVAGETASRLKKT